MDRYPRCGRWLASMGCLHPDSYALARGVSIGLLIGLTPTVGGQILMMIVACTLFRGNFLAAFAVSWISNPLTMGPLYFAFNQIGEAVFAPVLAPLTRLSGLGGDIIEESVTTFLGSLVVAIPAAIGGYFFSLWAARRRTRRRLPVLSTGSLPARLHRGNAAGRGRILSIPAPVVTKASAPGASAPRWRPTKGGRREGGGQK